MTNYKFSPAASEIFESMRHRLYCQDQFSARLPSGSVTAEFLCWYFNETQAHGEPPVLTDFKPETKVGRRRAQYGEGTLRPVDIRKLAGVDSVTADRKLR